MKDESAMVHSIAEMIVAAKDNSRTAENIREMHKFEQGAEALRLIVRDNVAGAGDAIVNALWENL